MRKDRAMAVTGLFATKEQVRRAIDDLIAAGFPADTISAVTPSGQPVEELTTTSVERMNDVASGAGLGALIGAVAGLIIAPLVLPGIGLLVAGPLALGGALAGGLIGAFSNAGYTPEQARLLAERVEAGRYAVVVHTTDDMLRAETALRNAGAEDVHTTSERSRAA
jgi:outer membrane lipoprotein SlyB